MRVWATCVVALFGIAELYQWVQAVQLPLPVYGIAGLALALASNAKQWQHLLLTGGQAERQAEQSLSRPTPAAQTNLASDGLSEASFKISPDLQISQSTRPQVELPPLSPLVPQAQPISFTIPRPQKAD